MRPVIVDYAFSATHFESNGQFKNDGTAAAGRVVGEPRRKPATIAP